MQYENIKKKLILLGYICTPILYSQHSFKEHLHLSPVLS